MKHDEIGGQHKESVPNGKSEANLINKKNNRKRGSKSYRYSACTRHAETAI